MVANSRQASGGEFPLTEEHRMLLRMRDTLYEGSWEDFERDLQARAQGEPHVFETLATSPQMKATIESHLAMIDTMRTWEVEHSCVLRPDDADGGA